MTYGTYIAYMRLRILLSCSRHMTMWENCKMMSFEYLKWEYFMDNKIECGLDDEHKDDENEHVNSWDWIRSIVMVNYIYDDWDWGIACVRCWPPLERICSCNMPIRWYVKLLL